MTIKIAGIDVKALVGSVAGPLLPRVGLTKVTRGVRDPLDPTAGRGVTYETVYGSGVVGREEIEDNGVKRQVLRATLIAATFSQAPDRDDRVLHDGAEYRVLSVKTDPAGASHVCELEG